MNQQPSVLKGGHYYGNTVVRRETSGVLLTEALYPAGHVTPSHVHERAYFSFVLKGSNDAIQNPNGKGGHASQLMFYPPGALHLGQVRKNGGSSFFIEIAVNLFERVNDHLKLQDTSIAFNGGLTNRLLARLYREFRQIDSASEIAIEGLVLEMLAQCSRDRTESVTTNRPRFITQAREIIHEHYSDKLSLSVIAKLVNVHPVYLATEFRRFHHCSIGDYIRRIRIDAACPELANSSKSLAEIGAGIGFSHQAHFTRTFKDHIGLTPSEYRRHVRK